MPTNPPPPPGSKPPPPPNPPPAPRRFASAVSLGAMTVNEARVMLGVPPIGEARKVMCEGCGAPLQDHEVKCSWCTRATGRVPDVGVLRVDGPITEARAEKLRREWARRYTSSTGPK